MEFQDLLKPNLHSKKAQWLAAIIGGLIVILAVFQLGMYVGFKKAGFSYHWADNYRRSFGAPRGGVGGMMGGFMGDFEGRDFTGAHGVTGKIIKIDGNYLYVVGSDNLEKVVAVSRSTRIMKAREIVKITDLKIDDELVVIGSPSDNGVIEAKMIRVFDGNMPPPPVEGFMPNGPTIIPGPNSCPPGKFCQ